jgi:hypothetical protein
VFRKKGNFRPEASPSIRMKRHERKNTLIKDNILGNVNPT